MRSLLFFFLILSAAASAENFGYTASGCPTACDLRIAVTPPPGVPQKAFVGATTPDGGWYALTPRGWSVWTGGEIPSFATIQGGVAATATAASGQDLSVLAGTQVLGGYGTSTSAMLAGGTFGTVYTVPPAWAPPVAIYQQGVVLLGSGEQLPRAARHVGDAAFNAALAAGQVRILLSGLRIGGQAVFWGVWRSPINGFSCASPLLAGSGGAASVDNSTEGGWCGTIPVVGQKGTAIGIIKKFSDGRCFSISFTGTVAPRSQVDCDF